MNYLFLTEKLNHCPILPSKETKVIGRGSKRESETVEYISDEGEGVDSICSAVLMLGHFELQRKILNTKFSRFHLHSSGSRHTHSLFHTPTSTIVRTME